MRYRINDDELREKARRLKLMAFDVDGVMTDGRLVFNADGEVVKVFHALDGQGLKFLREAGIKLAIITGRNSPMVQKRANDLGFHKVVQGRDDKGIVLQAIANEFGYSSEEVGYAGDDVPDVSALQWASLSFSVPNAHRSAFNTAHIITERTGGMGAVRDICDIILAARLGESLP